MGRKRKSSSKSKKTRKSVQKSFSSDMIGGILIVLGLVLFVFLKFDNIGVIPKIFNNLCMGLFGYISYLLPIVLIFVGGRAIYNEEKTDMSKDILKGTYLTCIIAATIAVFVNSQFNIFDNFVKYIIRR